MMPAYEASGYEKNEGTGFQRGGEKLSAASPANAAPLQEGEANYSCECHRLFKAGENGHQFRHVFADYHRNSGHCSAARQPITPADDKSGIITQRPAGEVVLSAAARDGGAQFRQRGGAAERVDTSNHPDTDEQNGIGQPLSDISRRSHNSGCDRIADRYGDAKPQTEDLQKTCALLSASA